ncbi:hypothetical protein [Pseudoxanthomonas winnipegensis]|uniref:Uncharacterized protein n=1 Tax=Pseudoxanthomonas winnipegensis TaxID=2480810 RepID=A0A4Q8LXE2_9GAMM|nr:hypothetical protein [Pseudoxanthomonas winnipegensis]RZZ90632.1 hypothetical protein EA663_02440 [Pseudoxanthomonas winnipegensis]TAA37213.1 hypothetical protein EA656_00600 [Pseudoxanthomonas winnipegensis]
MRPSRNTVGALVLMPKPAATIKIVTSSSSAKTALEISRALYSSRDGFSSRDAAAAFAGVQRKPR